MRNIISILKKGGMFILLLLMNASLAITFSAGKYVLTVLSPLWFLIGRMAIASVCFYIGHKIFEQKILITKRYLTIVGIFSLFNIYLANIFQLWALKTIPSAKACLLYNCNPLFIALILYVAGSEVLKGRQLVGIIISFLGLALSVLGQDNLNGIGTISSGELIILMAALSAAIGAVLLQKIMRSALYPLSITNALGMLIATVMATLHLCILEPEAIPFNVLYSSTIMAAFFLVTITTIVCAALYAYLLKFYSATFLSLTSFSAPLIAALFDRLLFATPVSASFFAATGLIFAGLYIFYKR